MTKMYSWPSGFIFVVLVAFTGPSWAQYCSRRITGCCPGRDDSCTAPIGDTVCYCDDFCLRSKDAADCCPDFFNNCTALSPPNPIKTSDCFYVGSSFFAGDSFKVDCNICTCLPTAVGYAIQCDTNTCLIREGIITSVNSEPNGWQAGNYSFLWGMTLDEGEQRRLGTKKPAPTVSAMKEINIDEMDDLPESFDSRQKWPGWIEGVSDQGNCGSSWAVSTTAVASDRMTIQSTGKMGLALSPQNLLSCNTRRQQGCDGGHLDRAWYFMRRYGVVTDVCYPYKSGMSDTAMMNKYPCMLPRDLTTPCPAHYVTSEKYKVTPPYRISEKEEDIKAEIFKNGPVQATFLVKEDFYMYTGGVYKYTLGSVNGASEPRRSAYHSVRILGWGVDRTDRNIQRPYWLCANSWGEQWGENGLFRIQRGSNECKIESYVLGVWGNIDMDM
ncbi:uncharacterized peptidase C1-like protein F26E4.3 [Asterias amurensis]|uniref:uncharacterized peptidase C1-like protein F26E4.3 n=1 Tax=Asterias amurensis TaxID=7602 RepID=UPI003AB8EA06